MRHGFLFGEAGLLKDGPDFLIMETEIREAAAACRIKNLLQLRQKLVQSTVSHIQRDGSAPPGPAVFLGRTAAFSWKAKFSIEEPGRRGGSFSQLVFRLKLPISVQYSWRPTKSRVVFEASSAASWRTARISSFSSGRARDRKAELIQTDKSQKTERSVFSPERRQRKILNSAVLLNHRRVHSPMLAS